MSLGNALERERTGLTPGRQAADAPAAQARVAARPRRFSLLRASVGERLGLVAAVLAVLWLSVYLALQ